jgi:glucose-6-phosphate dehydrogenase assembly protein OpcA
VAQALDQPSGRTGVDAQAVEADLRELWRREAASLGSPVTRLRTLNLVVMAGEHWNEILREALSAIPSRRPARVVVLAADSEAGEGVMRAEVDIHSAEIGGAERQVCGEEITLRYSPTASRALAGAVLPLLVQDLPTYLWWAEPGNPLQSQVFEDLGQYCDRTIVDSGIAPPPGFGFLQDLGRLAVERRAVTFADLTWNRLYPWRELTAQLFDGAETRDALDQITTVELAYDSEPGGSMGASQALLYVAWLAGRMGWRPTAARTRGSEREIWFDAPRGDVSVQLLANQIAGGSEGGLNAVTFACGPQDQTTNVLLRCADDLSVIESMVELPLIGQRRRITRFHRLSLADAVLDELDARQADEVFAEALAVVASMPERLGR